MVLSAFLAVGCNLSPTTPAFLAFGGPGFHSIDCSRSSRSWQNCYEEAAELCSASGGFYVLREYENATGSAPGLGPVVIRTLCVRCFPTAADLVE